MHMISTCGPPTKLQYVPPNGDHTAKLRTTDFSATTSSPSDRTIHSTQPQKRWWRRSGSNRRPPACKAGALPAELRPLYDAARTVMKPYSTEAPLNVEP